MHAVLAYMLGPGRINEIFHSNPVLKQNNGRLFSLTDLQTAPSFHNISEPQSGTYYT
jgi:hypothetical protein